MKNLTFILILLLSLAIYSCKNEPKDFAEFSGKVANIPEDTDSLLVFIPSGYEKKIAIDKEGNFSDTLKITEGKYQFRIGNEYGTMHLKNGDKLHLTTDYKDFDKKLTFSGNGNSVAKSKVETELLHLIMNNLNEETASLPRDKFNQKITSFRNEYAALKAKHKSLDPSFWKDSDSSLEEDIKGLEAYFHSKIALSEKFTGKASPEFTYESIDGKNVSLKDLRGKYVYIDIWATWCGPCIREIPALKELEKKFHGKDLEFVSISIDKLTDKEKWQKFVEKEQLTGIQLFADNDWESDFVKAYEIQGIPRFILLDKEGNIINPDAPRPSDAALERIFNGLDI